MMKGFESVETLVGSMKLSAGQRFKLGLYKALVGFYRTFVMPFRKGLSRKLEAELDQLKDIGLTIPDHGLKPGEGNHYLGEEEVRNFELNGFHGPFRVISEEDAANLEKEVREAYANQENSFPLLR